MFRSDTEKRILVGLACITAMIIVVGWVAINEEARMEEFTERAEGRSVELGGGLFEANCASCHGYDGLGLNGVAPALNSPHLFGYNYYAEIDAELRLLNSQLSGSLDDTARAELQTRFDELLAERTAIQEDLLYNWESEIASLDEALAAVDEDILALGLEDVTRADALPIYISRREADELAPLLAERDTLQAIVDEAEDPENALTAEQSQRLAELETEITAVEDSLAPYQAIADRRATIVGQRQRFLAVQDAQAQVATARTALAEAESGLAELGEAPEGADPNAVQREELTNAANAARSDLDTAEATRDAAFTALIDNQDIVDYSFMVDFDWDETAPSRISQTAWGSTLYDFVHGTLVAGRPTSSSYWPNPMVAWSNENGGPLRPDQINYLTQFVLNWDRAFNVEDLRAVRQFPRVPTEGGTAAGGEAVGDDVGEIVTALAAARDAGEFEISPAAGQAAFAARGCAGCHGAQPGTGPALTGLWSRAVNDEEGRLTTTGHTDNPEAYLIESIVLPDNYIVPGFSAGIMPQNFDEVLSLEELANILAYLEEQD